MANIAVIGSAPVAMLKNLPGWEDLDQTSQNIIERETHGLEREFRDLGKAKLAIGKRLATIQDTLGRKMFKNYYTMFQLKRSTAYGYAEGYRNAAKALPMSILMRAAARNMNLISTDKNKPLGAYTDHAKKIPPPESEDPVVIDQYLDVLNTSRLKSDSRSKRIAEIEIDERVLLLYTYRFASNRLSKIPSRGKAKQTFLDRLVGMLLTELGISNGKFFEPEAIPEGFRGEVGRPRKESAA